MIRGYFLAFGEDVAATQVALVDGGPRGSCRSPSACRLGRELHSEELGLLSDDAPHPAVTERQAVAPLVLLAWRA